jgi:dephospho-CoA kinase
VTAAGRTVRIGLTGPIGCGKSTVAGWLAAVPGVVAIDADTVARDVLAPGSPALAAVAARFGPELVDRAGVLDRAALGRIVFGDAAALRDLEAIVHPAVRPRIVAAIEAAEAADAPAVVIEAIKLVEGGLAALCDEVWLVTCDPDDQLARVERRGDAGADARQRIAAQGDLAERLMPAATRVLDTSGDEDRARDAALAALLAAGVRSG